MIPITPTSTSAWHPVRVPTADEARTNPWLLWRPESPAQHEVLSVAELADCECPDLCDRDHPNE